MFQSKVAIIEGISLDLNELSMVVNHIFPDVYKDYERFLAMKTYHNNSDINDYFYEYITQQGGSKFKPEMIGMYMHNNVDAKIGCRTLNGMNIFTWPKGHKLCNRLFVIGKYFNFDIETELPLSFRHNNPILDFSFIETPKRIKRPKSAYIFFCDEQSPRISRTNANAQGVTRELGNRWLTLKDQGLCGPYVEKFAKDVDRYDEECTNEETYVREHPKTVRSDIFVSPKQICTTCIPNNWTC